MVGDIGVALTDVTSERGRRTVLRAITLELGEPRIGLIGDNGAGKSSLFRLLCGLDAPASGTVRVHGHVSGLSQSPVPTVGMLFQNPDDQIIFPTVEEELAVGLEVQGLDRRQAKLRSRQWLTDRGLGHWAERAISSLSHGQKQHVCWLALTIAAPRLLLLDEPFASLDLAGQVLLSQEIGQASQQVIVSTHQLEHVRGFGRVIWLHDGQVRGDGTGAQVCAAYEADVHERARLRQLSVDAMGNSN